MTQQQALHSHIAAKEAEADRLYMECVHAPNEDQRQMLAKALTALHREIDVLRDNMILQ